MSHSTHYRSFQRWFYGSHDPTNSFIALKDDGQSTTSTANPTRLSSLKGKEKDVSSVTSIMRQKVVQDIIDHIIVFHTYNRFAKCGQRCYIVSLLTYLQTVVFLSTLWESGQTLSLLSNVSQLNHFRLQIIILQDRWCWCQPTNQPTNIIKARLQVNKTSASNKAADQ